MPEWLTMPSFICFSSRFSKEHGKRARQGTICFRLIFCLRLVYRFFWHFATFCVILLAGTCGKSACAGRHAALLNFGKGENYAILCHLSHLCCHGAARHERRGCTHHRLGPLGLPLGRAGRSTAENVSRALPQFAASRSGRAAYHTARTAV